MEARISGEGPNFFAPSAQKKSFEWDSNDWKWDGVSFVATPLNTLPSDCRNKQFFPLGPANAGGSSNSSSYCSDEFNFEKEKAESEKRRRVPVAEEDESIHQTGSLALRLGGHCYPISDSEVLSWEGRNTKKLKLQNSTCSRSICQVEGCVADLTDAKDYHRRHKVCEMHAKASSAVVGSVMQRFCQQCSRFHLLQEFDEGKRSCRRRLAGHNRRRRKTHPDAPPDGSPLNDDRTRNYLLISLLRILTSMHSSNSDPTKNEDFLSHLLRSLANPSGTFDGRNSSRLVPIEEDMQKLVSLGTCVDTVPTSVPNGVACAHVAQDLSRPSCSTFNLNGDTRSRSHLVEAVNESVAFTVVPGSQIFQSTTSISECKSSLKDGSPAKAVTCDAERISLSNIDLNSAYVESEEGVGIFKTSLKSGSSKNGCLDYRVWALQDSHLASTCQTASQNSDSASESPSSSNGDAQSRTDRIVFKLFGKDPSDLPFVLRTQILDWLSHSPTDIESYIRPGCIILTIYLRLMESRWEELSCNLSSTLYRLMEVSSDPFWQTGWMYTGIQQQLAFVYNGHVLLDARLKLNYRDHCKICSITPIAVPASPRVNFTVKGFNLFRSTVRLLCAFEGTYLVQQNSSLSVEGVNTFKELDEPQCLSFTCSFPSGIGRGFIEVEDQGLNCDFFPFIVAEDNVCSEIRLLESEIDIAEFDASTRKGHSIMTVKNQALEFLHEMGWLLRRSQLCSNYGAKDCHQEAFSFQRFKWLMEFSMDHDWCAVVRKLLDVLTEGTIDLGGRSFVETTLSEMGILHRAVRRNCRPMVEFLLRYTPNRTSLEISKHDEKSPNGYLFRPDMPGPAGVTPLHIAASRDGAEMVLDALTDDPCQVGIQAWRTAYDSSGFAPQDYARLRGYYTYIHLVQRKSRRRPDSGNVILDIPSNSCMQSENNRLTKPTGFQIQKDVGPVRAVRPYCKICDQQQQLLAYQSARRSLLYRPVMLSLLGIAAVCVCVGLLFKGPPEVMFVFPPFRWELLEYGSE